MRDSEKEVQHTSVAAVVSTTSSIAKKRQIRFHTAVMREALDGCRRESDNEECEGVKRPTLIVVCAAGGLRDSEECEGVMCPTLRVIDGAVGASVVLWSGTNKNRDVSTGPLARPLTRTAHSHRSLVHLLRTACFTHALRCAHSFTRALTSLTSFTSLLVG